VDRDDETVPTLGATTLALLAATWAPSTAATYASTIRRYFDFCAEQQLATLAATPAHMARYVAWLGQLGTIKASSIHPYLSAVNGFFKDHGREAIALGDLVAKVRKGLAASQVAIDDTPVRVHLPASIIVKALRINAWPKPYASNSRRPLRVKCSKLAHHEIKYVYYGHVPLWYYSTYSSVAGAHAWAA
jgi:hypothetical protein